MKTSITSFRIMLTERKEIGVMLFFKPVTINGRILKCYFTTDWNLISRYRLGIGSEIELTLKFAQSVGILQWVQLIIAD
nr:MAG TPA: NAD-dependent DNA ligase OB-fold domain [Caudoviricetes sp.]